VIGSGESKNEIARRLNGVLRPAWMIEPKYLKKRPQSARQFMHYDFEGAEGIVFHQSRAGRWVSPSYKLRMVERAEAEAREEEREANAAAVEKKK